MIARPLQTETHLEREIYEQPERLARFIDKGVPDVKRVGIELQRSDIEHVIIAARGSSDNAARYAQYLFGQRLGIPVALAAPSLESLYHARAVPHDRRGLAIGISQSGRSPDVVSVISAAQTSGARTVAITNDVDSPLARCAEFTIPLFAGPERSLAATKTYTSSLLAVACLATALAGDRRARGEIAALPELFQVALNNSDLALEQFDRYRNAYHVVVVGRGYSYPTAMEIALKIRELTGTIAEGFSSADLMHGPIVAIAPNTPVIIIATAGPTSAVVLEAASLLQRRGVKTIVIGNTPEAEIKVPARVPEWLSPIVTMAPGQMLALRWSILSGREVDNPPMLSKITETI
jgi:glucosamine--fructose-6-phosphate aminotransferase (isomerizing)